MEYVPSSSRRSRSLKSLWKESLLSSTSASPSTSCEHICVNSSWLDCTKKLFSLSVVGNIAFPARTHPSMMNSAPGSVSGLGPSTGSSVDFIHCTSAAPRMMCTGSLSWVAVFSLKTSRFMWLYLFIWSATLGFGRFVSTGFSALMT